jgi:hypothetical protein
MIRRILRKNKIKNANFFVEPDEIFLDSKNIQKGRNNTENKTVTEKKILNAITLFYTFHFKIQMII